MCSHMKFEATRRAGGAESNSEAARRARLAVAACEEYLATCEVEHRPPQRHKLSTLNFPDRKP